ncbi:TMEM175 family protein [Companilactobacillus kimchiensis]|uniref:Integral membrane protein n=1 Tax=Companilactobacillus kimchiensis TaxID=993692 RepID=A0A0R2LKB4_9LACO|nr:TMEM175 family protein [Companilactobacillus kimchiensis]KRO00002.1 hypothetical protein IV57_GL002016 [Companilactobacillus kimchiensis]
MSKSRLEAFSDGVFAIILTIMVLELKVPEHSTWNALQPLIPTFIAYVVSFILIFSFWVTHHWMLVQLKEPNVRVLWINGLLLLTMSFIPFTTGWVGRFPHSAPPEILYGLSFLLTNLSFRLFSTEINKGITKRVIPSAGNLAFWSLIGVQIIVSFLAIWWPEIAFLGVSVTALFWVALELLLPNIRNTQSSRR